MKIVFLGTPDFVLPVLDALYKSYPPKSHEGLIAVVTQPPKAVGRKKFITRTAVDNWGYKHKFQVITDLAQVPNADLGIVAAYGKIIPTEVIQKFASGILNIHPSLLPQFRGASPIQATILTGATGTGVSIIKMDELLDHGPIVSQFQEEVYEADTNETLRVRLFEKSAKFLIDLIPQFMSGKINLKEQNHTKATFTKTITKQDGFILPEVFKATLEGIESAKTWELPFLPGLGVKANAVSLNRLMRALSPWPGIWTYVTLKKESETYKKTLKIINAHIEENRFVPDKVQLEGKRVVTWQQFIEGYPLVEFKD